MASLPICGKGARESLQRVDTGRFNLDRVGRPIVRDRHFRSVDNVGDLWCGGVVVICRYSADITTTPLHETRSP
jgi:hypothetical protein